MSQASMAFPWPRERAGGGGDEVVDVEGFTGGEHELDAEAGDGGDGAVVLEGGEVVALGLLGADAGEKGGFGEMEAELAEDGEGAEDVGVGGGEVDGGHGVCLLIAGLAEYGGFAALRMTAEERATAEADPPPLAKDDNRGGDGGGSCGLPVFALAEVGDVGGVVAGVPGVEEGGELDGAGSHLGVAEASLPLGFVERLEEHDPAGVEGFDDVEGPLDRAGDVVEEGPGVFVVGLDGWPVFGEGELDADDGVHVGVGDVVDELADGPAAVAVGGGELGVVEILDGVAEVGRGARRGLRWRRGGRRARWCLDAGICRWGIGGQAARGT